MLKSIIIPVFGKSFFTKQCLSDLFHLDQNHEIIIVNNGSTDDTEQVIQKALLTEHLCSFKAINLDKNYGFAKACNIGYENSTGEVIIFLNNDIRVDKNHFNDWTKYIENEIDNTIVSPTGGYIDKDFNFKYETNDPNKQWNYLSGWCLGGLRKTFDKICDDLKSKSPFVLDMTTYFEDTYLSLQARKLDIKLKIIKVPIIHIARGTSRGLNLEKMYLSAKKIFINKVKKERLDGYIRSDIDLEC